MAIVGNGDLGHIEEWGKQCFDCIYSIGGTPEKEVSGICTHKELRGEMNTKSFPYIENKEKCPYKIKR
jgi:fructose-1,6-bisphosphatase/sedoheptulose 1,7-bisphosphatase-like protein